MAQSSRNHIKKLKILNEKKVIALVKLRPVTPCIRNIYIYIT